MQNLIQPKRLDLGIRPELGPATWDLGLDSSCAPLIMGVRALSPHEMLDDVVQLLPLDSERLAIRHRRWFSHSVSRLGKGNLVKRKDCYQDRNPE